MRVYPKPLVLLLALSALLAFGLLGVACGDSGDGGRKPSELGAIFTATPPDPLPDAIIVGDVAPVTQGETTYTVGPGDTLAGIADRFGTTVEAIAEANDIADPRQLEVGQTLVIPGGAGGDAGDDGNEGDDAGDGEATPDATPGPTTTVEAGPDGDCTYTVQSGDVANAIAVQYGLTDEEFAELNGTTVDDMRSLSVGDVLVVPCSAAQETEEP